LLDLIPKYFDPRAVTAVTGSKDEVTELLKLPFDFIFFTGSVKVGNAPRNSGLNLNGPGILVIAVGGAATRLTLLGYAVQHGAALLTTGWARSSGSPDEWTGFNSAS
jgi:hypothetical protein